MAPDIANATFSSISPKAKLLTVLTAVFSKDSLLMEKPKKGFDLMTDPMQYAGIDTGPEDRANLKIQGLVPAGQISLELDVERCMEQMRSKSSDLEKYLYLQNIQDVSERLYFAILTKYTEEVMPIVYTPT